MNSQTCQPYNPSQCNEISGGDTRLVDCDPTAAYEMFLKTGVGTNRHADTPLMRAFFSRENVSGILCVLEKALELALKSSNPVRVPFNEEFVQTMWDVARSNVGLTYTKDALAILNRLVIDHEAEVQYWSFMRRKLWIKYYITQDRMRVFPYGEMTKGTKGERTVSGSGYMLSNPWSRFQKCYLHDAEGIKCNDDGTYVNIPGYLQPKVSSSLPSTAPQLGSDPSSWNEGAMRPLM